MHRQVKGGGWKKLHRWLLTGLEKNPSLPGFGPIPKGAQPQAGIGTYAWCGMMEGDVPIRFAWSADRVRLISLELHGFKSFADAQKLSFPGGMTAVVGPNGCGKSNISDSLAWVLGEQRPSMMRGAEMADRKSTRLNSSHLGISYAV